MPSFDAFTQYYAESLSDNEPADATLKITNSDGISLIYCRPMDFSKRQTDTSNAQSEDRTSPDTGTAKAAVELRFSQDRSTAPTTNVLDTLLQMFYKPRVPDADGFRKARFGLENDDNPELNVTPTALGGYKLTRFYQEPNPDTPSLNTYIVQLDFIGDHTLLGPF